MALNVAIGLGVMAAGVVLWFLWNLVARRRRARAQRVAGRGPTTMELGEEPPAVVNLLVNELRLTDDAFAATVLDLAARRHLEVIQVASDHHLLRRRPNGEPVTGYEAAVLGAVDAAVDGSGTASVAALGRALGPGSVRTWAAFKAAVVADAEQRGLVAQPSTGSLATPLMVLAAIPTAGMVIAVPPLWFATPFLWCGLLLAGIVVAVRGRSHVLTPAGQAAGQRWLGVRDHLATYGDFESRDAGAVAVWDRYLAYSTAFDLSDRAGSGVVRELRTSVSVADVGEAVSFVRTTMRAQQDPAAARRWVDTVLAQHFGPGLPPDAVLGPGGGDFVDLLGQTMKGFTCVSMLARHEPELVRAACHRRLDELRASAPPEVQADVAVLLPLATVAVEQLLAGGELALAPGTADDPRVLAAGQALLALVAARLGVAADPRAVFDALARPGFRPPAR